MVSMYLHIFTYRTTAQYTTPLNTANNTINTSLYKENTNFMEESPP